MFYKVETKKRGTQTGGRGTHDFEERVLCPSNPSSNGSILYIISSYLKKTLLQHQFFMHS